MTDYFLPVWRYTPRGRVLHKLVDADSYESLCGVKVDNPWMWHGTGTHEEYERAEQLPRCTRCEKHLKLHAHRSR